MKNKESIEDLLRPSGTPAFTVIFTVKFHYFQIPHSSRNYILYQQIPILANTETIDLQRNSSTCKFHNLQFHYTTLRDAWAELHRTWGGPVIDVEQVCFRFHIHVASFRNESDPEAAVCGRKFRPNFAPFYPVKIRWRWARCLNQYFKSSLTPNLWYAFDGSGTGEPYAVYYKRLEVR